MSQRQLHLATCPLMAPDLRDLVMLYCIMKILAATGVQCIFLSLISLCPLGVLTLYPMHEPSTLS